MATAANKALLLLAGLALSSCMTQRDDRDYVQTNVVDKSLFEGEWYHTHTVVDNDQESTYAWAFVGSVSFDQANSVIGTIARVRFVIDEDYLYAFRSYPIVDEAERTPTGGRDMDTCEPMAAWSIDSHFDIVRRYNADSGEVLNVIEENATERPWYERRYMRVDWSSNNLVYSYNFNDIDVFDPLGIVTRQPASFFVQEGSEFPEEWRPQYDFTPTGRPCDPEAESCSSYDEYMSRFWDRYGPDRLYHFSFVAQEIWAPGYYPILYSWALPGWLQYADEVPGTSSLVSVRHAFLRVPDEDQYEPMAMPEELWERFGAWRTEQPTYTWGDLPDDENGLTNFYGQTDALNYYAGRHNIWRESFRYGENGERVPIPLSEREVEPVVYTLTADFPAWLIHPSFDLVGEWNGTLMETVRFARGQELPEQYIPGATCTNDPDREPTGDQECRDAHGDIYPYTTCRTSNDGTYTGCTRHYTPFQAPDPDLNDYDCYVVDAEGNPPSDPGYDLGAFEDERLAAQRGWHFVGTECALILRNNTCDDPAALAAAIEDRPACEDDPALCCDQMGDLRFNFLAFNNQVGVMWGGVSQPLQDPVTGELVQANANAAGLSVEGAMTIVGYYLALVDGDDDAADELSVMIGEDVRALMEASNYAIPPVATSVPPPIGDSQAGPMANAFGRLVERVDHSMARAEDLRGMEGHGRIHSSRLQQLADTEFERSLLSGPDGMLSMGFAPEDDHYTPTEEMLDLGSPFRNGLFTSELERRELHQRMATRNFYPSADERPEAFMDWSYVNWLRDLGDLTDQQRAIATGRLYYRSMMAHELGHSVGLRHNFGGSLDFENYQDEFYHIDDAHPYPVMTDFDADEDGELSYSEMGVYHAAVREAREARELAGIARHRSASIMEYMPRLTNDLMPLGRYDRAFMHFVYGNQLEVYTEDPREASIEGTVQSRGWMRRPDRAARGYESYFNGGERCRIDRDTDTGAPTRFHHEDCPMGVIWISPFDGVSAACDREPGTCGSADDCPFSANCVDGRCARCPGSMVCDDDRGWCVAPQLAVTGQSIGQRCGENPRAEQVGYPEDLPGVCMNYEDSWDEYFAVRRELPPVFPVEYRFCSDERTSDISWCSRFDEGESFREIMHNYRESWVRGYPFRNFRRYRWNWGGSSMFGTYADIAKVLGHFYYRVFYEPNFYSVLTPSGYEIIRDDYWLGWIDHMAGAAEGMNFLAEVIATPDVGSYEYDEDTESYQLISSGEFVEGSDLDIPVGLGRYVWSSYQEGTTGILRMERQGSYSDKLYALYALARREWGFAYSYDERFWINFYSLFRYEMSQLFGGVILDDPELFGARLCAAGTPNPFDPGTVCEEDTLFYQDLWRGSCRFDDTECRSNPFEGAYASLPAVGGGSNEMLRNWALIFSLAEFPTFFDTTYEQTMYLFVEGTGDSFVVRDCETFPEDEDCLEEGVDFARFFSERYNLSFVSMNVENQWSWEPETLSPSFVMVQRANEIREQIAACEADEISCTIRDLDLWNNQVESLESFFLNVIDIQGSYGISSWL